MAKQSRRDFFKTSALIGAGITGISASKTKAAPLHIVSDDRMGVLIDTTVCIGCRKCEWACKVAHDLDTPPIESYQDQSIFEKKRRPDHTALTVVNQYPAAEGQQFNDYVKVNCMHCDEPACLSACIVGAFSKIENGSVIWDTDKCIGCRYCMVACPYQIPAFEYDKAIHPNIMKCDFCNERTKVGQIPACVEICPVEVMTYGKRKDLVDIARKRIENNPDKYYPMIFGDDEVGGSSWMYLASKDFENYNFPKLGTDPAPGVSESIQHGIFAYFIPPVSLYALLGGIMWLNKHRKDSDSESE